MDTEWEDAEIGIGVLCGLIGGGSRGVVVVGARREKWWRQEGVVEARREKWGLSGGRSGDCQEGEVVSSGGRSGVRREWGLSGGSGDCQEGVGTVRREWGLSGGRLPTQWREIVNHPLHGRLPTLSRGVRHREVQPVEWGAISLREIANPWSGDCREGEGLLW